MDLIFTVDKIFVSGTSLDWRDWQSYFSDYKASLKFNDASKLTDYVKFDYKLSDDDAGKIHSALRNMPSEIVELILRNDAAEVQIRTTNYVIPN